MKIYIHQTKIDEKPEINFKYLYEVFEKNLHVDIIVCPEVFLSGFDFKNLESVVRENEVFLQKIRALCKSSRTAFLASFLWKDKNRYYNRAFFVDEIGDFLGIYDKQHLITAFKEEKYLSAGTKSDIFTFKGMRIGLAVCYDLRFPEVFRRYAAKEADLVFLVAQWPQERIEHMVALAKARAIENQCFVIVANAVGQCGKHLMGGHSLAIGHKGDILMDLGASKKGDEIQVHLAEALKWREEFPALYQYSRPGIFNPSFFSRFFLKRSGR